MRTLRSPEAGGAAKLRGTISGELRGFRGSGRAFFPISACFGVRLGSFWDFHGFRPAGPIYDEAARCLFFIFWELAYANSEVLLEHPVSALIFALLFKGNTDCPIV